MIFALAKLSAVIPQFNFLARSLELFFQLAEAENITIVFDEMPILRGFCARTIENDKSKSYIFLDSSLTGIELVYTAFHELSHYFLHEPRGKTKMSFYSLQRPTREELEADAGALLCLYPVSEIHTLEERRRHVGEFEAKLITRRLAIYKQFGV